jgi:hemin uptake protein HemP
MSVPPPEHSPRSPSGRADGEPPVAPAATATATATAMKTAAATAPGTGRAIASESLFAGATEVQILHRGSLYRLKQTALGKLILTK